MKTITSVLVILFGTIVLFGCSTVTETALKNDKGEIRYCYLHNDHTLVSVGAVQEYNRCLNDAGTLGFRQVEAK
jgi:hypothetical protein